MKKQNGQEVIAVAKNIFFSQWYGVNDSQLTLDFNPIINAHGLSGKYVLVHWQAKPKGLRTWGIFDSLSNTYTSTDSDSLIFPICQPRILDVDEKIIKTVPTAVIMFENVSWINGRIT